MQIDPEHEISKTSITLWRYWCSPSVMRDAVESLPRYDPAHEQGHVVFAFESDIADHSLTASEIRAPDTPGESVRYVYYVHMLHLQGSVIAICCRREIAWLVRNRFFNSCRLGTVELDIDRMSHDHSEYVERLHCRLENNPKLSDITLAGPDVMQSDLFRELGSATYLSASFRASFDQKDEEGHVQCTAKGMGKLLSAGLKDAFCFDTEATVTCTRSGTMSVEPIISYDAVLTFAREALQYERRHSDWQS